jgi:hypothetical protein
MASQVLSGSSNVSYTNNTGQNVRIVINYMASPTSVSWTGGSVSATNVLAIGRNLAFSVGSTISGLTANNASVIDLLAVETINFALPTELMLSAGQTFSATCDDYNIVVIPEAG